MPEARACDWEVDIGLDSPERLSGLSRAWISNLRTFFGASQEDFALRVGVSRAGQQDYERGRSMPAFGPMLRLLAQDVGMLAKSDGEASRSLLGALGLALARNELPSASKAFHKIGEFLEDIDASESTTSSDARLAGDGKNVGEGHGGGRSAQRGAEAPAVVGKT